MCQGCATLGPGWVAETWHSWSPVPPSVHSYSHWSGTPASYYPFFVVQKGGMQKCEWSRQDKQLKDNWKNKGSSRRKRKRKTSNAFSVPGEQVFVDPQLSLFQAVLSVVPTLLCHWVVWLLSQPVKKSYLTFIVVLLLCFVLNWMFLLPEQLSLLKVFLYVEEHTIDVENWKISLQQQQIWWFQSALS